MLDGYSHLAKLDAKAASSKRGFAVALARACSSGGFLYLEDIASHGIYIRLVTDVSHTSDIVLILG